MILKLLLMILRLLFIYWLFYWLYCIVFTVVVYRIVCRLRVFPVPALLYPSFIWSSFYTVLPRESSYYCNEYPSIFVFLFFLFSWVILCSVRTVTLGKLLLSKWASISALCCTELSVMKKTTTDWSCYLRELDVNYTCILLTLVITSSHDQ